MKALIWGNTLQLFEITLKNAEESEWEIILFFLNATAIFSLKHFSKKKKLMNINILVINYYLHLTQNVIEMPVYCFCSTLAAVFDIQKQKKW